MAPVEKRRCSKCERILSVRNFYKHRNGEYDDMCRDCLCMHVNNFEPDTFIWLMERFDIPYVPPIWNKLRDRDYQKDPNKIGGAATFGKYLSASKLKQFKKPDSDEYYVFAESEEATEQISGKELKKSEKQKEEQEKFEAELREKFDAGEISEAEFRTLTDTTAQLPIDQAALGYAPPPIPGTSAGTVPGGPPSIPGLSPMPTPVGGMGFMDPAEIMPEIPDPSKELTDDNKVYLAMKWGMNYSPREWVELEKNYDEFMDSFDIQDADTKHTLLLMCKTDLKANQALDMGDFDGFQKLARVSADLRKSGKFTAAQNKEKENEQYNCLGRLVAFCEKEGGFIPKYYTPSVDEPKDMIDVIIRDQENYTAKLVKDMGFGQQLETYLKKIELEKEMLDVSPEGLDAGVMDAEQAEYSDFQLKNKMHDDAITVDSTIYDEMRLDMSDPTENRIEDYEDGGASR